MKPRRVLIVGFGNVLHQDDAFGVLLLQRLEALTDLPAGVELLDAGIGGIHLVQVLMGGGFDALIVLDALAAETPADVVGAVKVLQADVPSVDVAQEGRRRALFADIHYAEPNRALRLARGVGVLPPQVFIVGCFVASCELGEPVTSVVDGALARALSETLHLARRLLRETPLPVP